MPPTVIHGRSSSPRTLPAPPTLAPSPGSKPPRLYSLYRFSWRKIVIPLDINVLLRYLLHEDEARAVRADAVFGFAEIVLITDVVLAETVWTLAGRK